jgi:hypothetical protein
MSAIQWRARCRTPPSADFPMRPPASPRRERASSAYSSEGHGVKGGANRMCGGAAGRKVPRVAVRPLRTRSAETSPEPQ